ncbi:MAG TPA: matrixin family metalloprotease [Candidatus Thermoplasmatota archaeon]|nr:matrixin family metalloprotease [Candidatus Thermoplasmatota archaeon]
MIRTRTILALAAAAVILFPSAMALGLEDLGRIVLTRAFDENGELMVEQGIEAGHPELMYTDHYLRLGQLDAKPGGGADPGTDCESDNYRLAGWHWTSSYRAQSDSYASIVGSSLGEWDQNAGGSSISAGSGSGDNGNAGVLDGVNQLEWESLGASSTVAVTTTWSYRGSGVAVESDGRYNTYYPWSTSGASNAMDVESVVQHETGHTFGLNHPSGSGIECLTMYAYVNYGWTHGRTLGDGDILGIKAIYG